uniref:Uncharacterized protein n=1 Tax=Rhizophora mucronata TaxID=61149 RepID=A0A2P2QAB2_RHIMU
MSRLRKHKIIQQTSRNKIQ